MVHGGGRVGDAGAAGEHGALRRQRSARPSPTRLPSPSLSVGPCAAQFVQHAAPLLQLFVLGPLKRWMSRGKAITQEDMDNAHLGPAFTMGKRLAVQLNILFTCFLYSSGMPALLLLAAFSFGITYLIDKTLMLRLYKQPPQYDAALARLASSIMTWAVVFHLAMAIYMLGEDSVRSRHEEKGGGCFSAHPLLSLSPLLRPRSSRVNPSARRSCCRWRGCRGRGTPRRKVRTCAAIHRWRRLPWPALTLAVALVRQMWTRRTRSSSSATPRGTSSASRRACSASTCSPLPSSSSSASCTSSCARPPSASSGPWSAAVGASSPACVACAGLAWGMDGRPLTHHCPHPTSLPRSIAQCCRRSSAVVPVDDDQKSQMELHMREAHANGASPLELAATKHWIVVRGFNEVYSERVSGEEAKLTDQQKREGWAQVQLERPGVPGPPIYLRYKTWLKDGKVKGCAHKAGQRKRTWEVIRDAGLHSYAMADNPSYAATLRAQSMSGDLGTPKASAQQEMV